MTDMAVKVLKKFIDSTKIYLKNLRNKFKSLLKEVAQQNKILTVKIKLDKIFKNSNF